MSTELQAAMLLPAAVGAGIVLLTVRGTATLRRLLGSAATRGRVKLLGDPLSTRAGLRCAWIRRRFRHTTRDVVRSGGSTKVTDTVEWLDDAEVLATEASLGAEGRSISLDLREAELVSAPESVTRFTREELERERPALAEKLMHNSIEIELVEEYLADDAFVNVYGKLVEQPGGLGYRDLSPSLAGPLVVLVGSRATLLTRSLFVVSLVLGMAGGLGWVAWMAWYELKLNASLGF